MSIAPADPHESLDAYTRARLALAYPNTARLLVAFRLAPTRDVCARLLAGARVDPEALDPAGLAWARERQLVTLAPAIDVLELEPAA